MTAKTRTYVVANPRGIPHGSPIVCVTRAGNDKRWYEGDSIAPKDAFSNAGWLALLAAGLVEEVSGG
jgi:hypothetical protein